MKVIYTYTDEAPALANALGVSADSEYAALWVESYGIYRALGENLPPAETTDENVLAFYQPLVDAGALPPNLTAAQVRDGLGDVSLIGTVIGVRDALADKAEEAGVTVNPRFGSLALPMVLSSGQGDIFFDLPYRSASTPVTDAPAQTETPAEPAGDGHDH